MTIEIKQLVIRAIVDARRGAEQRGEPQVPAAVQQPGSAQVAPGSMKIDQEALRSACARELRRELRKTRER